MLIGERVELRPVRESDLPAFISAHFDLRSRGAYFPLGVLSESALRRRFAETGFWDRDEGTLLICHEDEIVGHIEYFMPVSYWDAFALEGTVRGAFFNDGRNQDVLLYSLLRTDPRPWGTPAG